MKRFLSSSLTLPHAFIRGLAALLVLSSSAITHAQDPGLETLQETELPYRELAAFAEAFNRIKSSYVEEVDDKKLIEGAIAGMLASLDPHSNYLSASAFIDLQSSTKGEYGGLGIHVEPQDGFIKVVTPMEETPAHRAGILAGDIIVKIDSVPIKDLPLDESISMMKGEIGVEVVLSIVRQNLDKPLDIPVKREIIRVPSVSGEILGEDLGYVRVNQFQHRTGTDFRRKLEALQQQNIEKNKTALKGLVLDLRNNPGGVLSAAIDISDALLSKGTIVSTKGRTLDSRSQVQAEPGDLLNNAPIVVLINNGSASASEIVAGALQDHKRALIIGTRSFGKGSVQSLLPIQGDSALKLTTARYYTPSGHSIQGQGISPDIEVKRGELVSQENANPVYESDLRGTLSNDSSKSTAGKQGLSDNQKIRGDNQLAEAVNLLRGFTMLGLNSRGR